MPDDATLPPALYRPSLAAAACMAAAVLGLYVATLGSSSAMWDTSEYIVASVLLGVPHPPGNPFFVLLGRLFAMLPLGSSPAERVNLLAALCSAASAGLWFLVAERVLAGTGAGPWTRRAGAALASLIGATAFSVWSQSVVAEKVYTVSLLGLALVSWLAVRWCDAPDGNRADRRLLLIAYLSGLGYAVHMVGVIALPAVALAVILRRPRTLRRGRLLLAAAAALLLGITPFAMQPVRAAYFPVLNEGGTTGCRTEFRWDCTLSRETYEAFQHNFSRDQFAKPSVLARQAPLAAQIDMWWYYFRWQWLRDAYDRHPTGQLVLALVFLVLGIGGAGSHWKHARASFWYFGTLVGTLTLGLVVYLNFLYGATQAPWLGDSVLREVRDRDYFFLWGFSAWSVWVAVGLIQAWQGAATLMTRAISGHRHARGNGRRRAVLALASPVLLLALVPLAGNWSAATHRGDTTTRDFAHDLLDSVEPYGVLVTAGDNDTFPLWYAQEVEGIRRDVLVVNTSLLGADWYLRQLIRMPVRPYDAARGPAIYRGHTWTPPAGPVVHLTLDEADAIPEAQLLSAPVTFRGPGEIRPTIAPRVLTRTDVAVLRMIQDSANRPFYFARTIGSYAQDLGLGPWLVTQGLARKLVQHSPGADHGVIEMPGEGFVDVARTRDLWLEDSLGPRAMVRRNGWPDRPSISIPFLYVATGLMLHDALVATGQAPAAGEVLRQARAVADATHLTELLGAGALSGTPPNVESDAPRRSAVPPADTPAQRR